MGDKTLITIMQDCKQSITYSKIQKLEFRFATHILIYNSTIGFFTFITTSLARCFLEMNWFTLGSKEMSLNARSINVVS